MSGSLKPYFYVVCRAETEMDTLQQCHKAVAVIRNREHIRQHFTFRTENEEIVLVLGHVDTHTDHDDTSREKNGDAVTHRHFCLVAFFHINRLAVSN